MDIFMDNEISGKAIGGKALANTMTPQERKAKSMAMVLAKKIKKNLPRAEFRGEIKIGNIILACAVLGDGRRLISEHALSSILGTTGGKNYRLRNNQIDNNTPMPLFLASKPLKPYIIESFTDEDLSPVVYIDKNKETFGYPATILPKVCEAWLKARDAKTLQSSQQTKALKAEILMRGLATVGVIALVDEATGYQRDREKNALAKILEAFVAKELQPYLKTFPAEYYENLFRIYGESFPPQNKRPQWRPAYFGKITNNVIYERLAPELLPELKKLSSQFNKKTKLHQWLTTDKGHPKLREHLASIVTLLKLSQTPADFKEKVDLIHPRLYKHSDIDTNE
jgi:hypothetical protein